MRPNFGVEIFSDNGLTRAANNQTNLYQTPTAHMTLTERQRSDLHISILEYLLAQQAGDSSKFANTVKAFRAEAGLPTEQDSGKGVLEKKWTAVVRLQKRVLELESKVAELEQTLKNAGGGSGGGLGAGVRTFMRDGGGAGGDGRLLPRPPAKATMTGHRAPVTCVAVHPVYTLAATGSEDMTIKMWDFDTAQFERTLKGHTGHVTGVAFDVAGNMLASCSADMSAKLWDLATYSCVKTLKGHDHTLSGVVFLPAGDTVATCSRDQTIKLWEVATGYCTKTLAGHSDWVRCLSVSLDGELLASGGSDHCVLVWKLRGAAGAGAAGQLLNTLRGHEHVVETVSFGRKPVSAADIIASEKAGGGAAPEADGASFGYLASGSRDRTVRLWDAVSGQCLSTFAAHENWVRCVLFHPSGKFILSCSDDKTIRVMDIKVSRGGGVCGCLWGQVHLSQRSAVSDSDDDRSLTPPPPSHPFSRRKTAACAP